MDVQLEQGKPVDYANDPPMESRTALAALSSVINFARSVGLREIRILNVTGAYATHTGLKGALEVFGGGPSALFDPPTKRDDLSTDQQAVWDRIAQVGATPFIRRELANREYQDFLCARVTGA